MSDVISNAYNFSEYISTGVDPRTGMFSASIHLGNYISYFGSGSIIPLSLQYSPSSKVDVGFGNGWHLPLTKFNKSQNLLTLSSGQSFVITWNSVKREFDIPYRKLKDIRVLFSSSKLGSLIILYKNGTQEIVDFNTGVLKSMLSASGLRTLFNHRLKNGSLVLYEIYDEDRTRVVYIDSWSDVGITTLKHYSNPQGTNPQPFQTIFFKKEASGFLLKVSFGESNAQATTFSYVEFREANCFPIKKIKHSTGLTEEVDYKLTLDFPDGAPIKKMPAVYRHKRSPGESQPDQFTTYEYSSTNYLGFGSGRTWKPNEDNLFNTRVNYKYRSIELINNKNKIFRIYNKYHLLDKELYYDNDSLYLENKYYYYADINLQIEDQVPQYSLLRRQETTYFYEGDSRTTILMWEYDEYANLILEIATDGRQIEKVYYPSAGEGRDCPPHPFKMIAYIKIETVSPPTCDQEYPPVVSEFKYARIYCYRDRGGYFVVLSYHKEKDIQHDFMYFVTVYLEPESLGKIISDIKTINGFVTTTKYSFSVYRSENYCKNETTITTHDGFKITSSEEMEGDFLKVIKSTDVTNNTTVYKYDYFGRKTEDVIFFGTPCEYKITKTYNVEENNNYIIEIDRLKNKKKTVYNNGGKLIKTLVEFSGEQSYFKANERVYDNFGCMISQTVFDEYPSKVVAVKTVFKYDVSGTVNEITHSDGRIEQIIQDPVKLTSTNIQVGLLFVIIHLDNSGREISKETYDNAGALLAKSAMTYDGYNNIIKIVDTKGRAILMTYDKYDRKISLTRIIDFQMVTELYQYPDFTETTIPNKISLNNKLVAYKEYDGLARITKEISKSIIDIITTYTYIGSFPLPSVITDQKKNRLKITYHPQYHYPIEERIIGDDKLTVTRVYDPKTGALSKSGNVNADIYFIYQANGLLKNIKCNIKIESEELKKDAYFSYTKAGELCQEINFCNEKKEYIVDDNNRPVKIIYSYNDKDSLTADLKYDKFSRVTSYTITSVFGWMSLRLELNSLGAETKRDFIVGKWVYFTVRQKYNQSQLLSFRSIRDRECDIGDFSYANESFKYDELDRLTTYSCDGYLCPVDRVNIPIRTQEFTHDIFGNIQNVKTRYILDGPEASPPESNIQTFVYNENVPWILGGVRNTNKKLPTAINFKYDYVGNMVNDDESRNYLFNALNQLNFVTDKNKDYLTNYYYSGDGDLIAQLVPSISKPSMFEYNYSYYLNGVLSNEFCEGISTSYFRVAAGLTLKYMKSNGDQNMQFLFGNSQGSVLQILSYDTDKNLTVERTNYTPYGESKIRTCFELSRK